MCDYKLGTRVEGTLSGSIAWLTSGAINIELSPFQLFFPHLWGSREYEIVVFYSYLATFEAPQERPWISCVYSCDTRYRQVEASSSRRVPCCCDGATDEPHIFLNTGKVVPRSPRDPAWMTWTTIISPYTLTSPDRYTHKGDSKSGSNPCLSSNDTLRWAVLLSAQLLAVKLRARATRWEGKEGLHEIVTCWRQGNDRPR